jgi:hypothetical protein
MDRLDIHMSPRCAVGTQEEKSCSWPPETDGPSKLNVGCVEVGFELVVFAKSMTEVPSKADAAWNDVDIITI